ncbi:hypothetical protein [Thiocapsa sp. UBA6158]|jgi:hypothetical protein|uniref:hypothetical protein n=1 Tax=Thiocapsa sp. UBA6158 TaxID=1947692 RepID=UPI0025DE954A|nr:hypothetical protein [Thiocapsa sp. UBA6158]
MTLQQALWLLTAEQLKQRRNLLLSGNRSTRKADMVEAISHELLSADLSQYRARLSELEQNAVAESVHRWGGFFDRDGFKAGYGSVPKAFAPVAYSYSFLRPERGRQEQPSLLPLFFYDGSIPEDLRKRLASIVAVPKPHEITSFADDDLPTSIASAIIPGPEEAASEPLRRLATETLIHHDLPGVLRLIGQGRISVGAKTGLPSSASMTKLESVLLGGDWYNADDDLGEPRSAGGPIRPSGWCWSRSPSRSRQPSGTWIPMPCCGTAPTPASEDASEPSSSPRPTRPCRPRSVNCCATSRSGPPRSPMPGRLGSSSAVIPPSRSC